MIPLDPLEQFIKIDHYYREIPHQEPIIYHFAEPLGGHPFGDQASIDTFMNDLHEQAEHFCPVLFPKALKMLL